MSETIIENKQNILGSLPIQETLKSAAHGDISAPSTSLKDLTSVEFLRKPTTSSGVMSETIIKNNLGSLPSPENFKKVLPI
jgi:hypothetical protein